ncbi:hypothetical protein [Actinomadura geliboluensis]|uniref:hypothetical protein n=1 Tax=Actinomadura geliboluensis TaxID=882440 RepID=UPI00260AC18A|nr:hypothetical protein [Actinomadura geliboluensis]
MGTIAQREVTVLTDDELRKLALPEPPTPESMGRLSAKLAGDPMLGLRVMKSLIEKPGSWAVLFTLTPEQEAGLSDTSTDVSGFVQAIDNVPLLGPVGQVTFRLTGPDSGIPTQEGESDNPWYVPDKVTIKVEGEVQSTPQGNSGHVGGSVAVEWHF